MDVNQKIEEALTGLVKGNIWPLSCPLEEKPDQWIVYRPETDQVSLRGDDEDLEWTHYVQVHWFAKGQINYTDARKKIRSLLRKAEFSVTEIYCNYETDTKITHLVVSCNIEEDADGEDGTDRL